MFHVPEEFRVIKGLMKSDASYGNNGAFIIPKSPLTRRLRIVASDGEGWEHVSVVAVRDSSSDNTDTPRWSEMHRVKNIFWDDEDCVMQLHPRKSQYVNMHPHVLHMWRPATQGVVIPEPPEKLVGLVRTEH